MGLRRIFLAASILLFPCVAANVYACQCRERQPPCAQYWEADAVFIGSVTDIVPADDPQSIDKAAEYEIGYKKVNFSVGRAYRGIEGKRVELIDSMTSCRYVFEVGSRYLVYAYYDSSTKTFSTHTCSRTSKLSEAAADLDYIGKLANISSEKFITGILADGQNRLRGVKVVAERERRVYRSTSDRGGWFRLAVPEPGKYLVRIFLPHNVGVAGASDLLDRISNVEKTNKHYVVLYEVEVKSSGCTFIDVPLFIFGRAANNVKAGS